VPTAKYIIRSARRRVYIITNITITTNANFEGPTTRSNKHYNERELLRVCVCVSLYISLSLSLSRRRITTLTSFRFPVSLVMILSKVLLAPYNPTFTRPSRYCTAGILYYYKYLHATGYNNNNILCSNIIILGTYLYLYDIDSRRPSTKAFQTTANSSRAFPFRL